MSSGQSTPLRDTSAGACRPADEPHQPAWHRLLFEQAREPVCVIDQRGRLRDANDAFADQLGCSLPQALQLQLWDWDLDFPRDRALDMLGRDEPAFERFESRWRRADGVVRDVEVGIHRLRDGDDRLVVASARDITAQKHEATALLAREGRLSLALSASDMGVWEWDLQNERVLWSAALARLMGRDPAIDGDDSCSTEQLLKMVHRDDLTAMLAARHEALHHTGALQGDFRFFGYDGRLRWVRDRGLVERRPDGQPLRLLGTRLDVTEQYRIQLRLLDDSTRRRVMIEQSRDGVVVLNTDGSVDEANQAFADLLGYSLAQVMQMRVWDWDATETREQLLAALASPDYPARSEQINMRRQDGALITVDVSICRLEQGGRKVFFSVCRDITARLAIETALRDSEARYRATFDNSPVGIAENALDGRWITVNPRLCEITGYSREALLALHHNALTHADDLVPAWRQLRRVLQGELQSVTVEKRYLRQDGSIIWVSRTSSLVRDAGGVPRYYVSIVEDITERKRAQDELARLHQQLEDTVVNRTQALQQALRAQSESEHFLRSIADNIPDMVGYWDAQLVLRYANRPYRAWFSPNRDPVGMTRDAFFGDPSDDRGEMAFAAALAGRAQRFEYALVNEAGEVRYAWVHYVPDHQGDRVAGLFVLVSDISDLKQAELRLQALNEQLVAARDRAEAANRAKSAFLANISHEIRTPMNAIIGLTHLMRHDARDGVGAERLAKVSQAANHLMGVINDVLDLSKIESGKLQLLMSDFEVEAMLTRTCSLVAERAHVKGLALRVVVDGNVPLMLRGDATRVAQALLNLMSNAVKFTDHGSIELRCELLSSDADALRLRFSVRDTGVGVPADKIGNLFGIFEQVDTSLSRRHGGTGLGLAITRRLAMLMGGEVGVDSAPAQGSCFWFTASFEHARAPVAHAAPATAAQRVERSVQRETSWHERLRGARVLLVEDNPVNQEVASELLRSVGLLVDLAHNGEVAVRLARLHAYDLILMDMQMPVMDGLAATRVLRTLPQYAHVPILAMTANAFGDDRQACMAAGMDDHLSKPVDPELLYAMLSRWLPARLEDNPSAASSAAIAPSRRPYPAGATVARVTEATAGTAPAAAGMAVARPAASPVPDFSSIPGLTMSRALLYLPGRDQVYARVLRQFSESYRAGLAGLDDALQAAGWTEARRLLHSLRGACGAVGATELMAQALTLERQLEAIEQPGTPQASPTSSIELASALQRALSGMARLIDQRFAGMAAVPSPAAALAPDALAAMDTAMVELASLLEVADFRAASRFRTLEPTLRAGFGEEAARNVELPLQLHDYDAALAALQALQGQRRAVPAQPQ